MTPRHLAKRSLVLSGLLVFGAIVASGCQAMPKLIGDDGHGHKIYRDSGGDFFYAETAPDVIQKVYVLGGSPHATYVDNSKVEVHEGDAVVPTSKGR